MTSWNLAAFSGALLATVTMLAIKGLIIDTRLAPRWTVIAWVTWGDVLGVLPWLFAVGLATAGAASSLSLRRYLVG